MFRQTTDKSRHYLCEIVCKHSGVARKRAPRVGKQKRMRKSNMVRNIV